MLFAAALFTACTGQGGQVTPTATVDPLMVTLTLLVPQTAPTGQPTPTGPAVMVTEEAPIAGTLGPKEVTAGPTPTQPEGTNVVPVTEVAPPPPAEAGEAIPGPQCSAPASLTPPMTEGPYYTPGAPERTNLIEEGIPGERLLLTGFVLNTDCQPVAGARVDFWQADGQGAYDNTGYKLRGQQTTAADGSYRLETVIPGEYPGRTPHIHVKVQAPGGPELTSQVFFPGMSGNQTDRIFDPALVVRELEPAADGAARAAFDFIVSE